MSAQEIHDETKHHPTRRVGGRMDFSNQPIPYKIYNDPESRALANDVRPPMTPLLSALGTGHGSMGDSVPSLDVVTQLCYYSNGVTKKLRRGGGGKLFRAASCTGALYHNELYLVSMDLEGLDAGVYHFDPRTLSLDVLRQGDYRGVLLEATGGLDSVARAPLVFVATSAWWRNAWKYGERSYRHAFWDSGTVLANLVTTSHAHDLPAEIVMGFCDEGVAELIGVDSREEAPLELVPVGSTSNESPQAPEVTPINPSRKPYSREERVYELIHAAYTSSSLGSGEEARTWRRDTTSLSQSPGDGKLFELEPADDAEIPKTSFHDVVMRRGSCRDYRHDPLGYGEFSTILTRSLQGFPADFREPDNALQLNELFLIVNAVEDLPSGAYQYHPESGAVELLRSGDYRREAGHLALDQELGKDAAACCYFMTDLDHVTERMGDRGYRAAQLEAAVTAGKLYLAAYSYEDLGGSGLTYYDDEVTEFFLPRSTGTTPTFLMTLGRPTY